MSEDIKHCPVYVVERGYDYEGHDAIWAGPDRESALAFADAVEFGHEIRVTCFAPLAVEVLTRSGWTSTQPDELVYLCRRSVDGVFQDAESVVRTRESEGRRG